MSISDLFNGNCGLSFAYIFLSPNLSSGVIVSRFNDSEICSLKIFGSDNLREVAPKETTKYEIQLERIKETLDAPEPIEKMIDLLSEVSTY